MENSPEYEKFIVSSDYNLIVASASESGESFSVSEDSSNVDFYVSEEVPYEDFLGLYDFFDGYDGYLTSLDFDGEIEFSGDGVDLSVSSFSTETSVDYSGEYDEEEWNKAFFRILSLYLDRGSTRERTEERVKRFSIDLRAEEVKTVLEGDRRRKIPEKAVRRGEENEYSVSEEPISEDEGRTVYEESFTADEMDEIQDSNLSGPTQALFLPQKLIFNILNGN